MSIETANRLYHYRATNNYTPEQLAEKLGVTADTVLSWEHAESSPDTDALIALSKLYGVTVDELLKDDEGSVKDTVSFKNGIHIHSKDGDKVDIGLGGVHVHDKNGEKVDVGWNGVFVNHDGEQTVYTDDDGNVHINTEDDRRKAAHKTFNQMPFAPLMLVIYVIFGLLDICGGWWGGWIVFLAIPLYYSLGDAIYKRNPSHFAYPVLVAAVYLYFGMFMGLWHPMWVIFLTIPFYYCVCDVIKNARKK